MHLFSCSHSVIRKAYQAWVCIVTLIPSPLRPHFLKQSQGKKKKKKQVTSLKLHVSPVARVYATEKVSPLQIESQLVRCTVPQNRIKMS